VDRRDIQDDDIEHLATTVTTAVNLEMACPDKMLGIAHRLRPHQVTLVPERREEIPTQGGRDAHRERERIGTSVARVNAAGIRTSLLIGAHPAADELPPELGAAAIELHTGRYAAEASNPATLAALRDASRHGASIGLAIHAGHGLTAVNVKPVAAIPEIEELNTGNSVIGRAIFGSLEIAVREPRGAIDAARSGF
jgi:pyridoxine 5-phosphate synthase